MAITANLTRFEFELFVFYPETGELHHDGVRIRINRQTAELLGLLLAHAGSLVTREQMRETLWPDRELLEHDRVINNGISRLRYIFQDDPRQPKYIERIPKRGYRLVISVVEVTPQKMPKPILEGTVGISAEQTDSKNLGDQSFLNTSLESVYQSGLPSKTSALPPDQSFFRHPFDVRQTRSYLWLVLSILILIGSGGLVWKLSPWHGFITKNGTANGSHPTALDINATSKPITIGIVPFEADSPEALEIASSMRLDLTDVLSRSAGIRMRAAHSLGSIKPDGTDLSHQMTALGLDEVLFGRLSVKGQQFHFELELVRASDGSHVGTLQYTGTEAELSTINNRIQRDLVSRLQMSVPNTPTSEESVDPKAYQVYLRGRYQFSLQNEHSLPLALRFFSEAAQIDPKFAKAFTYLARTNIVAGIHGVIPRAASLKSATESLAMAEQLDRQGGEIHELRGILLYLRDWNLPAAQNELLRAIEIDPSDASYHQWLAIVYAASGRSAEAQTEVERARSIDPYWIPVFLTQSYVAHNAGKNALMMATARELKEMAPGSAYALDVMGNALWYDGKRVEAVAQWRSMAVEEHDMQRVELEDRGAAALRSGGVKAYAQVRISAMHTGQTGLHPNDFEPAEWYATAGDDQAALAAMRRLYAEHDPTFFDLALDPVLINVRKLREFQIMLRHIPGIQIPQA